jgi:ABC-type phosphate transport system substrate-binding protein
MRSLSVRRLIPVCIIAVLTSAALVTVGVGVASAKTKLPKCSGGEIKGQGAAAAQVAIEGVWDPDFNTSTNAAACPPGPQPKVNFHKTSSGEGLESWGVFGKQSKATFGPQNAFVATEEPPNGTDITEIEDSGGNTVNTVETIPVAQETIAILVHLPADCTSATSTSAPGRLVLDNETLAKIWAGELKDWGEIKEGGDTFEGAGCTASTAPITRIVRKDIAGTTHVLKKYLGVFVTAPFATTENGATNVTWDDLSEGAIENLNWPTPVGDPKVQVETSKGDSAEVTEVANTVGSIGYAGLADARANTKFQPSTGGPKSATFWVEVQNTGTSLPPKKQGWADPSVDNETSNTPTQANCAKEKYTNGFKTFPPASTLEAWSSATTETKEKAYPLCTFVYILALNKFSLYSNVTEATTPGEAETLNQYLQYVLETKGSGSSAGGQVAVNTAHDYEELPKKIDKEALIGADEVAY